MKKLFTDLNLVLFGIAGIILAFIDLLVIQDKAFVWYKPYFPQFGILGVIGHVMMIAVLGWFVISRFLIAPVLIWIKKRKKK